MDTEPKKRAWYEKKRYLIPLTAVLSVAAFGGGDGNSSSSLQNPPVVAPYVQYSSETYTTPAQQNTSPAKSQSNLSNDNYYTNVNGNSVHSPAYSDSVPAGASAQCRDGTYSFSQNRRGTCSGHGGGAEWL